MGVGCPEFILLFRKLPTNQSKAYADEPVRKSKEEYTRARWQIDAHGYWRSSGDRLVSKEELKEISVNNLQRVYRQYSREHVYDYEEHVRLAEELDREDKLPATFMVVAPGSWDQMEIWDDINRMRTLNTQQSRRQQQMHVCPLQLDIVERIINRFSNEGDTVLDPFGGLMTVPMAAVRMKRKGYGIELNPDYFRDGVGYLQAAEEEIETPTLFDFIGGEDMDHMQDKKAESMKEVDLSGLKFPIIAVYKHPQDYPDKYVARIYDINRPTNTVVIRDTLQELQADISQNTAKTFIARDEQDEPCVVGSWI